MQCAARRRGGHPRGAQRGGDRRAVACAGAGTTGRMMFGPRSLASSIVSFALALLAASIALNLAATFLQAALPVLIPVGIMTLIAVGIWRWHNRPRGW